VLHAPHNRGPHFLMRLSDLAIFLVGRVRAFSPAPPCGPRNVWRDQQAKQANRNKNLCCHSLLLNLAAQKVPRLRMINGRVPALVPCLRLRVALKPLIGVAGRVRARYPSHCPRVMLFGLRLRRPLPATARSRIGERHAQGDARNRRKALWFELDGGPLSKV
jgi:hypothetical protein